MACNKCSTEPVYENSVNGNKLCSSCFIKYFEKKVFKTIRQFSLIEKGDKIGVAVSGGKDSISVLHIMKLLQEKHVDFELTAIAVDEGIAGYRSLEALKKYCKEENVNLHIFEFKKDYGKSLDEALPNTDLRPCTVCGVLRRTTLNKEARKLGLNKLATGHNLDDEAQSVLMNYLKGNVERSIRLGPKTFAVKDSRFIQRIKPLFFLSEKEVATYAFIKEFPVKFNECPNTADSYRNQVRELLNGFELKFPGTKNALVNTLLEMMPALVDTYSKDSAKSCEECGEPSSGNVCNTCKIIKSINS